MRYYKIEQEGYILVVGVGSGGKEIDETEYNDIVNVIENKPISSEEYDYRLKSDLTWEKYKITPEEEIPEATEEDYQNALRELGVEL